MTVTEAREARTTALAKYREAEQVEQAAWQHHQRTRTRDSELAHREAEGARRRADLDDQGAVEALHVALDAERRSRLTDPTDAVSQLLGAHSLLPTEENIASATRAIRSKPTHPTIGDSARWVAEVSL